MKDSRSTLILVDAIINVIIGVILLLFPLGIPGWLGLPHSANPFYPLILGAVILGIGLALIIEFSPRPTNWRGLGLEGAITINFCGGGMLLIWLIFFNSNIPLRGLVSSRAANMFYYPVDRCHCGSDGWYYRNGNNNFRKNEFSGWLSKNRLKGFLNQVETLLISFRYYSKPD